MGKIFENYITVIGVSEFGENISKKLIEYQNSVKNDFLSNYLYISSKNEVEKITDDLVSNSELIMIVADLENSFSRDIVSQIADSFSGKFVIGFFNKYKEDYKLTENIVSIVNLAEGNHYDSYYALRLIPDLLTTSHIRAIFFEDLKRVFLMSKLFRLKVKEFSQNPAEGNLFLEDIDLSESSSLLFGTYGDSKLHIETVSKIEKQITDTIGNNILCLSSVFITEDINNKIKLVIFY